MKPQILISQVHISATRTALIHWETSAKKDYWMQAELTLHSSPRGSDPPLPGGIVNVLTLVHYQSSKDKIVPWQLRDGNFISSLMHQVDTVDNRRFLIVSKVTVISIVVILPLASTMRKALVPEFGGTNL
ncbi:hypothetical protein CIB48_g8410 [Xylaria polymorpha]|nr:hypothetical protein CIB48_g8410 [Xylaria polymorpha]